MAERNYRREYDKYQGRPDQIKNRAKRNAARRLMRRELGEAAIAGKDIDHKRPLSKGGSNSRRNLQVMSVSKNRSIKNKK